MVGKFVLRFSNFQNLNASSSIKTRPNGIQSFRVDKHKCWTIKLKHASLFFGLGESIGIQ